MAVCEWIILCDYAFPAAHGKLCLIGIFDTIFTKTTPAKHSRVSVGFSIVGEPGERGDIKLEIIGPTGQPVAQAGGPFTLPDAGSARVHFELPSLPLPELGRYAIEIDLGEERTQAWFTLAQAPT